MNRNWHDVTLQIRTEWLSNCIRFTALILMDFLSNLAFGQTKRESECRSANLYYHRYSGVQEQHAIETVARMHSQNRSKLETDRLDAQAGPGNDEKCIWKIEERNGTDLMRLFVAFRVVLQEALENVFTWLSHTHTSHIHWCSGCRQFWASILVVAALCFCLLCDVCSVEVDWLRTWGHRHHTMEFVYKLSNPIDGENV